jgi:hypothetical protein
MPGLRLKPSARARAPRPDAVSIELSQPQLARILRDVPGSGAFSLALVGPADLRAARARAQPLLEDSRLSRSLTLGVLLLAAFPSDGSYISNSTLAHTLDLTASTTHRYVSTLLALGLIEQDAATRKYRLTHVD